MELTGIIEFIKVMFADFDIMELLNVLMEAVGGLIGGLFS